MFSLYCHINLKTMVDGKKWTAHKRAWVSVFHGGEIQNTFVEYLIGFQILILNDGGGSCRIRENQFGYFCRLGWVWEALSLTVSVFLGQIYRFPIISGLRAIGEGITSELDDIYPSSGFLFWISSKYIFAVRCDEGKLVDGGILDRGGFNVVGRRLREE